jgi:hypothetical protein
LKPRYGTPQINKPVDLRRYQLTVSGSVTGEKTARRRKSKQMRAGLWQFRPSTAQPLQLRGTESHLLVGTDPGVRREYCWLSCT